MPCMRIKGVLISRDFYPHQVSIAHMRCKMWSCPHCGPINAASWRAYLLQKFNSDLAGEKWIFVTITAHARAHVTAARSLLNLQQGWKKLYDRMLRRWGKGGLQYVRVFEQHRSGRYHMHALISAGGAYDAHGILPLSLAREFRHPECIWLRRACVSVGLGWRVHMRRVWDHQTRQANAGLVVGYMMKYMAKNLAMMDFPKHQRRVQTSRKIGSPAVSREGRGTWVLAREFSLEGFLRNRIPHYDISLDKEINIEDFENEAYYPPIRYYRG